MESHDLFCQTLHKARMKFRNCNFCLFSQIDKLILMIKSYKILCENTEFLFIQVGHATIWTIYSNL